jgi:hypothetical protein
MLSSDQESDKNSVQKAKIEIICHSDLKAIETDDKICQNWSESFYEKRFNVFKRC